MEKVIREQKILVIEERVIGFTSYNPSFFVFQDIFHKIICIVNHINRKINKSNIFLQKELY